MNAKMNRVEKAISEAQALADQQRARDNPLLAVEWLPGVQQRWRDALQVIKAYDFASVPGSDSDDFGDDFCDALEILLAQRWEWVLSCASIDAGGRLYHTKHRVGFLPAFADLLVHLEFDLLTPLIRLLTAPPGFWNPTDERADVIAGWLRAIACGDAEIPASASRDAVSAIVRAVLDADPDSLGFSAWCVSCGLLCPQRKFSTPWPLHTACPGCGSADRIYQPLGRGVDVRPVATLATA